VQEDIYKLCNILASYNFTGVGFILKLKQQNYLELINFQPFNKKYRAWTTHPLVGGLRVPPLLQKN